MVTKDEDAVPMRTIPGCFLQCRRLQLSGGGSHAGEGETGQEDERRVGTLAGAISHEGAQTCEPLSTQRSLPHGEATPRRGQRDEATQVPRLGLTQHGLLPLDKRGTWLSYNLHCGHGHRGIAPREKNRRLTYRIISRITQTRISSTQVKLTKTYKGGLQN